MNPRSTAHLGLGAALALGLLLGACGGGAAEGPGVATPPSGSSTPEFSASSPSSSASPAPAASGSTSAAPSASTAPSSGASTAEAPVELKAPIPTAFADDLKGLGLDPAKLPPMAKLEPKQLRGVMKLFTKSLGIKCADCHQDGDFAAATGRKKIATQMWDQFAAKLTFSDGTPLFCDSCHQGRTKQLVRTDKKALSKWMDASFVQKLKRRNGAEHNCETCHVEWNMTFLSSWAK
jgi:hypothetical protein